MLNRKDDPMARGRGGIAYETMADVLERLGGIDPGRVRLQPPPGQATERDLLALLDRTDRLYELVEGVLVEKVMGFPESALAMWLCHRIQIFLDQHDLGFLAGEAGATRLMPGLVRMPDLSFISWDRVPVRGQVPSDPIAGLAPDLAIEVLSKRNTRKEMERKLREYFLAGVRLVWFVDPRQRTVRVYTRPDESRVLVEGETLDGGEVLPGLALSLDQVFARVPRESARPPRSKGARRSKGQSGEAGWGE